ncbi:mechanosensitive ion channel family protein [Porphyromonas sp. COT-108 OH1349]|uniref:Mechanosensitive ion channel protein MscS n=2 Tax=Porphyromonas canoris TaxID=36875 RepID=A0ABR4XLU7_9PORP|nr:mechanosensitive ion channel domain-containing protein [Porphyromonas sp. COT-108 OH1349]KGL53353.1 mechanosensitive ion channel protein MscS [Porphyromonas canoris]KGN69517.1 mechanosensitive ion channel protein MscS [Porphyromonas sp. COT-108 OH1349]KGN92952.1 mechanosensitive ion channel protein MscS [Porphyromonas canoris]
MIFNLMNLSTTMTDIWTKLQEIMNFVIFDVKGSTFTLLTLLYLIVASTVLIFLVRRISKLLDSRLLVRISERGTRAAIVTIIRYLILFLGFLLIFKSAGFELGTFSWLLGALGVGIGFGLQNITNNFLSGIIILFERPIKVGDRIQVGDISGDVVEISMRATTVVTNDNISVIVPNSQFINGNVINWSHSDRLVRFRYPVGVAYKEKPERVKEIVLNVARNHPGVLSKPAPDFWFVEYGDSALKFELIVWTSTYIQRPTVLKSELYYAIFNEFNANGIEVPFPQRDLHIRTNSSRHPFS